MQNQIEIGTGFDQINKSAGQPLWHNAPHIKQIRAQVRAFVEHDLNVLRLHAMNAGGNCICWRETSGKRCSQPGKHPIDRKDSRPDYRQHSELFDVQLDGGHFDSGYGVDLTDSGLLIVDIDARNGGLRGFEKLVADHPEVAGAGMVVESGSGGGSRHLYFAIPETMRGERFAAKLDGYAGVDIKTTGFVVGSGSRHKGGGHYRVALGGLDDIEDAPAGLLEALRVERPDFATILAGKIQVSEEYAHIAEMLTYVNLETAAATSDRGHSAYMIWMLIGSALFQALGDDGLALWAEWSQTQPGYDPNVMVERWNAASQMDGGGAGTTAGVGTILHFARAGGFTGDAGPEYKREIANKIWNDALPVAGTVAQEWLAARGLTTSTEAIRFHMDKHLGPCIVAQATTGGIVRVPLGAPDDSWQLGPTTGGVIVLSDPVPGAAIIFAVDLIDALKLLSRAQEAGEPVCVVSTITDTGIVSMNPSAAFLTAAVYVRDGMEAFAASSLAEVWRNAGAAPVQVVGPGVGGAAV